ncbi:MAG: reverse transcriptase/maturase family protein [Lachnospiraceae bacterium]|nr:reverse transcriptase/maturase family protein [Lachnospiraceae bacterium]
METILKDLLSAQKWEDFYNYRTGSKSLSRDQESKLRCYIDEKRYLPVSEALLKGVYEFSIPKRTLISKGGSDKKRTVYRYTEDEVWILKHLAFLLHVYDEDFSDACYSFIRGKNAKTAVREILSIKGIGKKYCLKADIHDFFNSIPRKRLCEKLDAFTDDVMLKKALTDYLSTDLSIDPESKEVICANRGAMAGTPLAPFLANLYLSDLDEYFTKKDIHYFRYADDILMFADDRDSIEGLRDELNERVHDEGLSLNGEKTKVVEPGKALEFLGFKYDKGIIDLSDNTRRKIRAKIRRKAHALYRWRLRKQASFEQTAFVMIRSFNNKFYDVNETGDFSWSRWFFPVVNTDAGFHEIDEYLVKYVRYLYRGRHYKGNYRVSYEDIKALGFRPLVNEYHKGRNSERK